MTSVSLETKGKALKLRAILNQFSDISYSFARLNRDYPFDHLDEHNLKQLITTYEELIETAIPLVHRFEQVRQEHAVRPQGRQTSGVGANV